MFAANASEFVFHSKQIGIERDTIHNSFFFSVKYLSCWEYFV